MTQPDPLDRILARLRKDERDEVAWSELYKQLWSYVLGITYRSVRGDRSKAEDLAQETFMRLARRRPFKELQTSEAFRAYVWRVAENECKRYFSRVEEPVDVEDLSTRIDPLADSPSETAEAHGLYARISSDLQPVDREILRLTNAGYSSRQIAQRLGLSQENVDVRRHRAREKVRDFLKKQGLLR